MAHVGMKYPVAAILKDDGTYEAGFVVGKAITFTGTPANSNVVLYADDGKAETDKTMQNLGTSLNVDDISLATQAKLLGHTYIEAGQDTPEKMEINANDVAPYVGMGFYKRRRKNNVTSFTAIWLYQVQNSNPTENAATKGETTEFQTDTIEGTAYPLDDGSMYEKVVFTGDGAETAAKTWLNTKAGIVAAGGATGGATGG